jgi:diaminopimelate epimerase
VKFVKMHGTGNDFLFVEATGEEPGTGPSGRDWPALAKAMCDRHFGVGADGLMLVLPSEAAHVRMRLFNVDGSEAEVSGNGVRCLVKYVVDRGLAEPESGRLAVQVAHDVIEAEVSTDGGVVAGVRLSMGAPRFDPKDVPVLADVEPPVLDFPLEVDGQTLRVTCLSMGNPHAVYFFAQPLDRYPLEEIGPKVEHHGAFPERVNFGVARVMGRESMDLRVWERGVGETLACGTGCCAAMVAARLHGLVEDRVEMRQPGGNLTVEWDGDARGGGGDVSLTGPAEFVFDGDWPESNA